MVKFLAVVRALVWLAAIGYVLCVLFGVYTALDSATSSYAASEVQSVSFG